MKLTEELVREILTGLHNDTFTAWADEPAKGDEAFQEWVNEIDDLIDEHSPNMVTALAEFAQNASEDVQSHEVDDFVMDHLRGSGSRLGEVLQEYAADCEEEADSLSGLFQALDKAGAVDWFDWNGYADSNQEPLNGLLFYVVPSTGGDDSVFLFTQN